MSLRDKLYFNVISFSYLILKKRWKLSEDNFYKKNFIKPNKVFIENEEIEPSVEGKIVIFKKDKIEKGWYFLGINHFGDNKNSLFELESFDYQINEEFLKADDLKLTENTHLSSENQNVLYFANGLSSKR